ncbi:MAG: NADPH-dependent 7-cyano-7-deazaguanine reductase QueF [Candidatus Melainabacteria bacterium]|nr:NADPH-dependent 7-cyano-7-deazaguanine reductase QueF [Candidatus Melainabacteria bacterium]
MTKRKNTLETFPNRYPKRDYNIVITCPEYTSVCPKTGLPDFGTIVIEYIPDKVCVELKSLKYYLLKYRNQGIFYEYAVNKILDDLIKVLKPKQITVTGNFTSRGGISTSVVAKHAKH